MGVLLYTHLHSGNNPTNESQMTSEGGQRLSDSHKGTTGPRSLDIADKLHGVFLTKEVKLHFVTLGRRYHFTSQKAWKSVCPV